VYRARVPKADPAYASKIGAYLGAVLPVYGREFDGWWRNRLVPEIKRNFEYLEEKIDNWEKMFCTQSSDVARLVQVAAKRGAFVGSCEVCRGWYEGKSATERVIEKHENPDC